jgi:hypothetical protein
VNTAQDPNLLKPGEIIQIGPTHKWAGCLAVVDQAKAFGCQAYVAGPTAEDRAGLFFIRLNWDEFERVGACVVFAPDETLRYLGKKPE